MKTKIIRLEEIDSTNRYLKNYREEGDEVSRCILIGFLCVASLSCLWLVLLLSRMHWILMWRTSH